MPADAPLIPEQRHQELLRLLRASGVLSIRTLTEAMKVSHMTVRRDIATLEDAGLVVSVKGGVRLAETPGSETPRERASRAALEVPRKRAIAAAASASIRDDTVVFLDAGTTCQYVVPHLVGRRGLTVVTNDFHTAVELFAYPEISTIHTGGEVDPSSGSSSGPLASRTVTGLAIDLALLSTGAWDLAHGVTTPQSDKLDLKRAVIAASATVFLLADSTKWGRYERFRVAPLTGLDAIVTDDGLPAVAVASLDALDVPVETAPV